MQWDTRSGSFVALRKKPSQADEGAFAADDITVLRVQSKRGGRVQLHTLLPPETEFGDGDKGEALYASELALSLEKLNFTVRLL